MAVFLRLNLNVWDLDVGGSLEWTRSDSERYDGQIGGN
jgi:hypothetical protein